MAGPFTATPRSKARMPRGRRRLPVDRNDLLAGAASFCVGFLLERLFRPFRKPLIVFYHPVFPYPHQERRRHVPTPRQLA